MASLAARRKEIADALADIPGLRLSAEGLWLDRANLPAVEIRPSDDSEQASFDGLWRQGFEVTVAVAASGGLERGQRALDELHDSVLTALGANLPAGVAIRRQAYGVLDLDGLEVLGTIFRVEYLS